ncbi:uncharacterized protein EV154DRAFT_472779 [Mucor mucedo]|uniref:uncharacterized protein n=1 Tax=Mucor mucedo TaxID=29922 RepID=UPI00221FBAD9|nr:uncharacterized protein EV154DRAFT_472779 [Mucor mucedo]KAI7875252.1 hypothetical protein EV154DRAFT_472779 [Mucor mucedo]
MTYFKELQTSLQSEFPYNWKLAKEKEIVLEERVDTQLEFFERVQQKSTSSQCQNIDLIVPAKTRTQKEQMQLDQFLNIIGSELHVDTLETCIRRQENTIIEKNERKFEQNDEKRQFRIQEFIKTEKSYVETLNTLVRYVVNPLKSTMQQKHCILNTFKCHKIFLNIDQILDVNQKFLSDLQQGNRAFGLVCKEHIANFECYRKYLLEQSEAQKLHAKEFKINQVYRRFISKAREQREFKRKRLQDILVEPVQRISRYAMMLRDILQLTPEDHSDFRGLNQACEKAKEIATMADDDQTRTATMFLSLYQSIKDSPCSLINQKRSLIAHLDATEIHRVTNKPTRAVSLFLFTDKILVASKSCIDAKEIILDELLTSPSSTSTFSFPNTSSKNEKGLKFKGWADIESMSLVNGLTEDSLILSASKLQTSNMTSFEKYFSKGLRLFSVKSNMLNKLQQFKDLFQKTKALVKQCEFADRTFYKVWNGVPTFCNLYKPENYKQVLYKNDTAVVYVDDTLDTDRLFSHSYTSPWIVCLIQAQDMKGFRFHTCTRTHFPRYTTAKAATTTIDFESIFWNNMSILDQRKRKSTEYTRKQEGRPRPVSHRSSIPSIGKLFSDVDQLKVRETPAISIGSDTSCSMIEDDGHDDDEDEEEIDYLTIKTTHASMDSKILLEDEMHEQWEALASKYELIKPS